MELGLRKVFSLNLIGFLGFATGGLVAYCFFRFDVVFLGAIVGGAVSGACITCRNGRPLTIFLSALGFAIGTTAATFLTIPSIIGLFLDSELTRLDTVFNVAVLFVSGFTLLGFLGGAISSLNPPTSGMVRGIRSFSLAGMGGVCILILSGVMSWVSPALVTSVVLLSYATGGGLYEGRLQGLADQEGPTKLSMFK
jgi:hypothetical protein